jgi:polyhydroxyalkanoate synthesis regulator phasin
MPKKKKQESAEEQSERFREAVREMIDAGELNPTEADEAFDRLVRKAGSQGVQQK